MKYSRTISISIFLLVVIGACMCLSCFTTNREGLNGGEQAAFDKAEDIKVKRELPSVQLWKDASKDAQDTISAKTQHQAMNYANDVNEAYKDINIHYEIALKQLNKIILPAYEEEPTSISLQQSKKKAEDSVNTIKMYLDRTKILVDNSMQTAQGPRPESTSVTTMSPNYDKVRPIFTTLRPLPNGLQPVPTTLQPLPNGLQPVTTTPTNTNTAPLNTGSSIERLNKMTPYEQWENVNKYYGFEALNEHIDSKILTDKDDGFAKFAANITPPIQLTTLKEKDDIVVYDTFVDYLIHLFTTYSEAFTSMVKITDENNDTYEVPAYHEVYYKDGELQMAMHDDTDYKGFIEEITIKREELEKEKNVKCDETIKCIADFDTRIGDKLCCGQKGRLRDTKYVCPENKPTCGNFKCGSKFGECS